MFELINTPENLLVHLIDFANCMFNGDSGLQLYEKYKHITDTATPTETMEVLDVLLKSFRI